MQNRILFFSGGLSSFAVAHHLKETYPKDNIVLCFTDTLWEDEDLYRFIDEVSTKLKLPLLKHSSGIDPVELMIKQKIIFNSRMGNCSSILKMKVASDYLKKGKKPTNETWYNKQFLKNENFIENAILYFGISFDEFHRTKAISENWKPFEVEFPLCKMYFDYDELLSQYNIKKPRLYIYGFTHNNCKGRCVKSGKGHYKLLYNEDLETFNQVNEIEHYLSLFVGDYHLTKKNSSDEEWKMAQHYLEQNEIEMHRWHDSGYQYKPNLIYGSIENYPSILKSTHLNQLKKSLDNKMTLDLFGEEIGGCGCFIEYEQEESNGFSKPTDD